jgi:Cysteine-rich CWC
MIEIEGATKLKTCEACGQEFGCGADAGNCWCFNLEADPATLEKAAASYRDCLCPNCLEVKAKDSGA